MIKGFSPTVPRYQQPLTLMAREATLGKSGYSVAGYRDYRGVPVYGAWLWDDKLGIGLTTEIDEAEAAKSESSAMAPFFDELVRLAENFELDGIQKFVADLDT